MQEFLLDFRSYAETVYGLIILKIGKPDLFNENLYLDLWGGNNRVEKDHSLKKIPVIAVKGKKLWSDFFFYNHVK